MSKMLLLAATLGLAACAVLAPKFEKPNLSVVNLEMLNGNFFQQNFRVTFKIQNPNDRALPVKGLHADLHVGGETIASGVSSQAFVLPAFGEAQFDMLVTANLAMSLLKLAGKVDGRNGEVDYDLTGAVNIDLPLLRDLPFHQSGSFALGAPAN
ncbi:MAG: LEA type 2 family protein [Steroidobacteraceae bacterium]|jgi:LEA14-like dessication related protein